MSGIAKGIKKAVKSIGKFVKKYWKQIVIAAVIVFTAGIAAVGVAGFSTASAAAGGGFAGAMSAAGSTMVAGVSAIGGTLGIGQGVTATTAGGAFATAPAIQGALAASGGTMGATLGTGAASQALGFAPNAARYAAGAAAGGVGPNAALAGGAAGAAPNATSVAAGRTVFEAAKPGPTPPPTPPPNPGAFDRFASSNTAAIGLMMAGQGLSNAAQARMLEETLKAQEPNSLWGVQLKGKAPSLTPDQMRLPSGPAWNPASFNPPPSVMPINSAMDNMSGGGLMGRFPRSTGLGLDSPQIARSGPLDPNSLQGRLAYLMQFDPRSQNALPEGQDLSAQLYGGG